ncbi:MAG: aromatic-L-amino-acid decarboxylase [Halioglobus sp.]|jgi:aromatic-L-amino-acid decarboxylase
MTDSPPDINAPSLLDPTDWAAYRQEAHRALDLALDHVQNRPQQPVWQEIPNKIKVLNDPLPVAGSPMDALLGQLQENVLPYTLGNVHPRFWGWVHGSGTPSAVVSQMMMAAINANMGGRDHAPMYLEKQVIQWMLNLFGFPGNASGIMCTGTSTATLLGLSVARQRAAGVNFRAAGNGSLDLVAYTSSQSHVSVSKAMQLMGLGSNALRSVPVREDYTMDCMSLAEIMASDLANGLTPFAVVSVIGAVNTGAIDDLVTINRLCRDAGIWHHVDGAFGALAIMSDSLKPLLAGISDADSIAFDFHKWMHVGYAAGCLLVRDEAVHRETFEAFPAYLQSEARGLAAGAPWPSAYGIELSRGFSALSVWFTLKEQGVKKLGLAIQRNCLQAQWLGQKVVGDRSLELLAPVALNIVCFRRTANGLSLEQLNELNRGIVVELHCRSLAVPSLTTLNGVNAIRVCICNHRTRRDDLQALLDAVLQIADELLSGGAPLDSA